MLKGVASGLKIGGVGEVLWTVMDSSGMLRSLKLPALYVPDARIRLLSIQSLLQTYKGEQVELSAHELVLSGIPGDELRRSIRVQVLPSSNLPTSYGYEYGGLSTAVDVLSATVSQVHLNNINLSDPQKEWLRWHERLGHMSFARIQSLFRTGVLARSEAQRRLHAMVCKLTNPPMCAACQFGKQTQRKAPGSKTVTVADRKGILTQGNLFCGQYVSADHFVCSTKGRLFTSKGKSKEDDMYGGGCIFMDHASSFVVIEFQSHLNTHETLKAKENLELKCRDFGVVVQQYLTDNGSAFTSGEFSEQLKEFRQIIHFAGVGAHHHNGKAERAIRTIMSIAHTMMLHSTIHWPDAADSSLWPMADDYGLFLYNHLPNKETGVSPHDIFTKTRWELNKLHDLHVWGSPVYLLDKTIQDGKKLPSWKARAVRTMMMDLNPRHASTVPRVLNLSTGAITPQYHVVFDDFCYSGSNHGKYSRL